MGKKDSPPDLTVSILLVVPEGVPHQQAAQAFLDDQGQDTQPIFFNPEEETVKIALARELLSHTGFSRARGEHQTLVLCAAHTATMPAQNALLKLVEEPPANTQIILVVRSGQQLLPTLVSRCREILWTSSGKEETEMSESATETTEHLKALQSFLDNPATASYDQLVNLAESLKDRQIASQVLRSVIHQSASNGISTKHTIMKELVTALDSLEKNGNVRLVLEHHFFAIHRLTSL